MKKNIFDSYFWLIFKDFSPVKHGTFKSIEEDTLTKMICGNVVTHTSDSAKTEIQVNPFSYFNDAGVDVDTLYRIFSFEFLFSI